MDSLMIPKDIRKLSRQRAPAFHGVLKIPQPDRVKPGQTWSTHSHLELPDGRCFDAVESRLVVVLDGAGPAAEFLDKIAVAPVSLSTDLAADSDLIISRDNSPLEFDFMVEVWNETPTLKGHLRRFVGMLSDKAIAAMHSLYTAQLLDEAVPEELKQWVGLRIMSEDDPRLAFQEAEIKMAAYLAEAATAALTLEVPAQEPALLPDSPIKPLWRFSIRPTLLKPSDVLSGLTLAHAAGKEVESYFIHQPKGNARFVFELRFRQRDPYTIYIKVHDVSPELVGRRCVVTVRSASGQWRSMPTALQGEARIRVGEDPSFRLDQVQVVVAEIE